MIPNPACIFENETTGETIVEDEDGCDYQAKGLISGSATYPCQSKNHNNVSKAVLSTVYNHGYQYNFPVIAQGAIVNISATRCDGIDECVNGSDENDCGMKVEKTILAGKTLLTCIFLPGFFFINFLYIYVAVFFINMM